MVFAVVMAAGWHLIPALFTSDAGVREQLHVLWPWLVGMMPVAGIVFALDGVLLGAGDNAFIRTVTLVAALGGFVPLCLLAVWLDWGLSGVWAGLAAFIGCGSSGWCGGPGPVAGWWSASSAEPPTRFATLWPERGGPSISKDDMAKKGPTGPGGLIIVDKPAGMTSHDVVAKVRRIAGTRRVGHAGTLDPMATGVLVLGVERATKLMNHLILTDKTYLATIRLGEATSTDDAEGDGAVHRSAAGSTGRIDAGIRRPDRGDPAAAVLGVGDQGGRRAGLRPGPGRRAGGAGRQAGDGAALRDRRRAAQVGDYCDLDVLVDCSSGTYVRALARDLGELLGVGGHLTALRRTRVGVFTLEQALSLEQLAELPDPITLPLPRAIAATMPVRPLTPAEASELTFGRTIGPAGIEGVYGGIAETGEAVALLASPAAGPGRCSGSPRPVEARPPGRRGRLEASGNWTESPPAVRARGASELALGSGTRSRSFRRRSHSWPPRMT